MLFVVDRNRDNLFMKIMGILVQYRYGNCNESTEYFANLVMELLKEFDKDKKGELK